MKGTSESIRRKIKNKQGHDPKSGDGPYCILKIQKKSTYYFDQPDLETMRKLRGLREKWDKLINYR